MDKDEIPLPSEFKPDDLQEFAANFGRMLEEGGKVAAVLAEGQSGKTGGGMPVELSNIANTLGKVAATWLSDPGRLMEKQAELWQGQMTLLGRTLRHLSGEEVEPVARPGPGDKRFDAEDWNENQVFDYLKQAYLLTSGWAENLVAETGDLDDHTRQKAAFYMKQLVAALAPTNFPLTNPEVLRETIASHGENLARGMHLLAEDLERGQGELRIRQSDAEAFEVGGNLAITPGKVIFQNDLMQLIQYDPTTQFVHERPLLIIPPWINKFYVLDLTPEKSFIRWAVDQGYTVFVVSWANPDARLAKKSFDDYMDEGVIAALDAVQAATGAERVNTVGYCVGGTMLAVTLAFLAQTGDKRIASATFLTTQVDFTHSGELLAFVDEEQIANAEKQMEKKGYLEGARMSMAFNMLRPNDLIWPYVVNNYLMGKQPFPFDLLYWNSDSTRMPAANHSFYLRECYLNNKLTKGQMVIDDRCLDLNNVTIPVYQLATREDHIAPALSVYEGAKFFGGPVRYVLAGSGHIAGVVNHPKKNKYQHWTNEASPDQFEDWLESAKENPGSWWPDWDAWLAPLSGEDVLARFPGEGKLEPIEEAPGSYVKVRAD